QTNKVLGSQEEGQRERLRRAETLADPEPDRDQRTRRLATVRQRPTLVTNAEGEADRRPIVFHLVRDPTVQDEAAAVIVERAAQPEIEGELRVEVDRKSTRLNSSHVKISYAVFCLKK